VGLTSLDRRDSSVQSKLKYKPCGLFFKDNGIVSECEKCGIFGGKRSGEFRHVCCSVAGPDIDRFTV